MDLFDTKLKFTYLLDYLKQDLPIKIHDIDFAPTFVVIIIDTVSNLSLGIIDNAAIAIQDE